MYGEVRVVSGPCAPFCVSFFQVRYESCSEPRDGSVCHCTCADAVHLSLSQIYSSDMFRMDLVPREIVSIQRSGDDKLADC